MIVKRESISLHFVSAPWGIRLGGRENSRPYWKSTIYHDRIDTQYNSC
ncbi:MAG: hypothetical protein K2M68_07625 [Muribaculaceae bacterium]|nr:hypothetical protein [Muribaculaceae bacterium]